jgi:antitoxin (DNA-binding transcriptional repressor) of toxin-antitoxin stability system
MNVQINAKQLRATLPDVVERVRKGARFTVVYRSRAAFQIVPMGAAERTAEGLDDDPIYKAGPLGRSSDGRRAADHDELLYR